MPANFLHGVETIELDIGPRAIRQVKTAVVGLVGTAPMFDVDPANRTLNSIQIVTNDRDARLYFGANREGFTIPRALDAIFDQGTGIVLVVNVLDLATDTTTVATPTSGTGNFTFDADGIIKIADLDPDDPIRRYGLSAVEVKSGDGAATYVLNTDYTVQSADGTIKRVAGGAIAAQASVRIGYTFVDPTDVTNSDIIGTVDGSGNRTGMQAFLDSYNLFGMYPKILIAPVFSPQTSITSELNVLAHKFRAIAMVDAPIGTTFQAAITGRGPLGAINFNTSSERLVLCYPHLKVYDIATDTEDLEPMSQRLAGVMCAKDQERGYWWSPSNTEFKGIVGTERRLTAMINDPTSEVNLLNEVGITTMFNSFGTGMRSWGNRTAAWPTLTHPRNFINIRRVADVIHESVEYSMLQFIDYPINAALIDAVTESVNGFLRTLVVRGAIIDGECSYDPTKNPAVALSLGHLTFDIRFMPPPPAERMTFESFIDISILNQLGRSIREAA